MDVRSILFFQTSSATPSREKVAGALRYLDSAEWPVELVEVNPETKDIQKALREWKPIGCIVDRGLSTGRNPVRIMQKIPTIYIDQDPLTAAAGNWYIRTDSFATVSKAFDEFLRLDSIHYVFIRHDRASFWNREREQAFRKIVTERGLSFSVLTDDLDLSHRLKDLPTPCSLLAANDLVARDVLVAAHKVSLRVPDDLRVIGINNDEFICQHTRPTLTSVHPDFENAGYLAMATLHRIVRGTVAEPQTVLFGTRALVRRASTRFFKRNDARVTRALDYISDNAADPGLKTAQIATAMGCSRSLADLLFRRVVGHTIRQEIKLRRLETAKRLLTDLTRELSVIPSLCGYTSLPTFIRTFKAATGVTPKAWRLSVSR